MTDQAEGKRYTLAEIVEAIAQWDTRIGFWLPNLPKSHKQTMRDLRNFMTDVSWSIHALADAPVAETREAWPSVCESDRERLLYCIRVVRAIADLGRENPLGSLYPETLTVIGAINQVLAPNIEPPQQPAPDAEFGKLLDEYVDEAQKLMFSSVRTHQTDKPALLARAAVLRAYAQAGQRDVKVPDAIKYCGDNERDRYTADGYNWCRAEVLRMNASPPPGSAGEGG